MLRSVALEDRAAAGSRQPQWPGALCRAGAAFRSRPHSLSAIQIPSRFESRCEWWCSSLISLLHHSLDAFVGQLKQLNHHFVAFGIEVAWIVLHGPRVSDDETRTVCARFVLDHNDDLLAFGLDLAGGDVVMPLKELQCGAAGGDAPLQRDVSVLRETAQLLHVRRIGAHAIVHGVDRRLGDHHLTEAGSRDIVDLEPETKIA